MKQRGGEAVIFFLNNFANVKNMVSQKPYPAYPYFKN